MRRVPNKRTVKEVDDLQQAETPAAKKKKKEARVESQCPASSGNVSMCCDCHHNFYMIVINLLFYT